MPSAKATLSVRHPAEQVCVIDVQGEVTSAAEGELMLAYAQACQKNARAVILNFTHMEYMNSSGIGLLVTLLIRINRQKQKLLTFGLNDHYRQVFMLTRLNQAIGIFEAEAEALAAAVV